MSFARSKLLKRFIYASFKQEDEKIHKYFLECRGMLLAYADSKLTEFQEKYPDLKDEIQELADNEPIKSKQNKYLNWAVKMLAVRQAKSEEIIDVLKLFDKLQNRLDKKDINSYKPEDFANLRNKLLELSQHKTETKIKEEAKSGGTKLFEDENYILIRTDTHGAACYYGKGTKWCITMDTPQYYEQYSSSNVLFYMLINKKLDSSDVLYKIAFAVQRDQDNNIIQIDVFNAIDNIISASEVPDNILNIVKQDAVLRPKSILFKIYAGEASDQEILDNINNKKIQKLLISRVSELNDNIISILVDIIAKLNNGEKALALSKRLKEHNYANKKNDMSKLEQAIINDNTNAPVEEKAWAIYEFALDIPEANIKKLQQAIIDTDNGRYIAIFARDIPKANIYLLQEAVIRSGRPHNIYLFARDVDKANIKELQEVLINSGANRYILMFARDIKGADIKKLQQAIIDNGIKERYGGDIFHFAMDVGGADIDTLQRAVINTKDVASISLFAYNVKGADTELLKKIIKDLNFNPNFGYNI